MQPLRITLLLDPFVITVSSLCAYRSLEHLLRARIMNYVLLKGAAGEPHPQLVQMHILLLRFNTTSYAIHICQLRTWLYFEPL